MPITTMFVHNSYQIRGGEDAVLDNETELIEQNGGTVNLFIVSNNNVSGILSKVSAFFSSVFSFSNLFRINKQIEKIRPDVIHVHNYFPLISPSVFYSCFLNKKPVVHTLHNYRAVCPTALLMYEGRIVEKSISGSSWWSIPKRVYRGSLIATFALACMVQFHKKIGTWQTRVDRFIALTEFSKAKFVEAGWPEHKISVKPNFILDPFNSASSVSKNGGYALFLGRISEEKGIDVLLHSWKAQNMPLKIVGDGPLKGEVEAISQSNVQYLGLKQKPDVLELIQHAEFIIMPSTWYEGFPMVLVEAFACGTPALVSRLGSMEEIVDDSVTGLHFEAGNSEDLAEKAQWMIDNPAKAREMGQNARNVYLEKYTPEKNYEMLMDIYQQAIDEASKR